MLRRIKLLALFFKFTIECYAVWLITFISIKYITFYSNAIEKIIIAVQSVSKLLISINSLVLIILIMFIDFDQLIQVLDEYDKFKMKQNL